MTVKVIQFFLYTAPAIERAVLLSDSTFRGSQAGRKNHSTTIGLYLGTKTFITIQPTR